MDNINSPGKPEGKGLFKGFLQIFTKQTSSPKHANNKSANRFESKSSSPKSGTSNTLQKAKTIKNKSDAYEEEKLQLEEKLAQNKFQEALVIDRETKQRLKEVIDGHRGSVIKRSSVLFVKSDAPSTNPTMSNLVGETIRDSDVELKNSTSISSGTKAEPSQQQQPPQQKAKTLSPSVEELDKNKNRTSLFGKLTKVPVSDKNHLETIKSDVEISQDPGTATPKDHLKADLSPSSLPKSRFSFLGKPEDSSPTTRSSQRGSFLQRIFGPKTGNNPTSPAPKEEEEAPESASPSPMKENHRPAPLQTLAAIFQKNNILRPRSSIRKEPSNKGNLLIVDEPETPAKFAEHEKEFSKTKVKRRKEKMYLFFNAPHSSNASLFYNILILLLYVSESTLIVLETDVSLDLPKDLWVKTSKYLIAIYVLEYILRLSCYNAIDETFFEFFQKTGNLVDLLAIIYTTFEIFFYEFGNYDKLPPQVKMLRALTILRWIRGFRFSIFNRGRKILSEGLSQSKKPLSILAFFAFLMVICFASLMFTIEANSLQDTDTSKLLTDPINTIPEAIWWAIITVTTVGYGDTIPLSFGGKILSLFALLFGVILISLPVAIMGNKFQDVYLSHKNSMTKKQRKLMKERVDDPKVSKEEKEIFKIIVMLNELEEINENIEKHLRNNKFLYRSITRDALNLISKIELTNKASALQQVSEDNPQEILASIRRNISKKRKGGGSTFSKTEPSKA